MFAISLFCQDKVYSRTNREEVSVHDVVPSRASACGEEGSVLTDGRTGEGRLLIAVPTTSLPSVSHWSIRLIQRDSLIHLTC